MISSNVKVAIIGAGTWGKNHAQIYNAHPFAETVAICDANLSKAQAVAQELGIPQVYQDYHEMLEKSGCDAVAIVTPGLSPRRDDHCMRQSKKGGAY